MDILATYFPLAVEAAVAIAGGLAAVIVSGGGDSDDDDDLGSFEPADDEPETLTVHTDGCGVIRTDNSDGALDLTWVVSDVDGFQVLGRNANGETRYRYFQPGTYTVVLETFGADSYVPVSNTVTINC